MTLKPINRDDLPNELLEVLAEMLPGMKIICAGDVPADQRPADVNEALASMTAFHEKRLFEGLCIDCGKQMENWARVDDEDWEPAPGWTWFKQGDDIIAWQCADCDAKEREVPT